MNNTPDDSLRGWSLSVRRSLATLTVFLALGLNWLARVSTPPSPSLEAISHERIAKGFVIDPNTVPPPVLMALPRLGPTIVGRIVEAREERPLESPIDLQTRVKGIGPATIASLEPFLRFEADSRNPVEWTGSPEMTEDCGLRTVD